MTWKRAEKTHPGKRRKIHTHKMHTMEIVRMENAQPGKWKKMHIPEKRQKIHTWKMEECKMHDLENGRNYTPRKKTENTNLENAQPG